MTKYVRVFMAWLLLGKDNNGGIINNDIHNNDKEFHIFRATKWLCFIISEWDSNMKRSNKK